MKGTALQGQLPLLSYLLTSRRMSMAMSSVYKERKVPGVVDGYP